MRFLNRLLLTVSLWFAGTSAESLEILAQWPLLDFELPASDPAFAANYQPLSPVPTGFVDSWHKIFISTPRLRAGVPATVAYFDRSEMLLTSSPKLKAYPSWDWHDAGKGIYNCSQIISVYRLRVDACNRLWILDSGVRTSLEDFTVVCPPKFLIFDLRTDQLVRSYTFPKEVRRPNNLFTNFRIDKSTATTCDDVFVYITDTASVGIITFDAGTGRSWRSVHASMLPDPNYTVYQIGDDTFELFDGIIGLALSEQTGTLFYQPLATNRLFSVPTAALRKGPLQPGESLPVTVLGHKSSQGMALEVEPNSNAIIFSPVTETAIAIWQPGTNYQRIISYNEEMLQFVPEIQWAKTDEGHLWVLSTRFHKFFMNQVNVREINFRLLCVRSDVPRRVVTPYALNSIAQYTHYNNTLYG